MNVLIISTIYPRGKKELAGNKVHGKFVHALAKSWRKFGAEIHVITPHSDATKTYEEMDDVKVHRFHYFFRTRYETLTYGAGIPENLKKMKNKLLVPFFAWAIFLNAVKVVKKYNIDIVNAHWIVPAGFLAVLLKRFFMVKTVTTAYGAELYPVISGKMRRLKPFLQQTIKKSDIVAGISEATVQAAKEIYPRNDIHVIPDGIDITYYQPGNKSGQIFEKYHIEQGQKLIFFSGRMVERKGHIYLLKAFHILINKLDRVKLVLGGAGPMLETIKNYIDDNGLEDRVELPGFVPEEDIVPLLQSADLFVLPSCIDSNGDTEGSATAALEAMACGTPALISKVGGNIGAVQEGNGAFYFEPANYKDLAEKLFFLLENELSSEMGEKARKYIEQNYTWNTVCYYYIKYLKQL